METKNTKPEITTTLKLEVTFIDRAEEGSLPWEAPNADALAKALKEKLVADDLHIEELKQFVREGDE